MGGKLPLDSDVVFLAEIFGKMPDEIADPDTGMSEYWFTLSVILLSERAQSKRKSGSGTSTPEPDPKDLVDGKWYLTG
jgi:hypothetical protein